MTDALLVAFGVSAGLLMLSSLGREGGIYEFPFLAGATLLGWALPQLVGLASADTLPPGALDRTLVMSTLCALAAMAGYYWHAEPLKSFRWEYDPQRLLIGGSLLVGAGVAFHLMLAQLPRELTAVSNWTGLPTIYFFFARMLFYGLVVMLFLAVRHRHVLAVLGVLAAANFYWVLIVFGRRRDTLEFFLAILLTLWFVRGFAVRRSLMIAAVVAYALLFHSIEQYRRVVRSGGGFSLDRIEAVDFRRNMGEVVSRGATEFRFAAITIAAVDRVGDFDYGLQHWNELVFQFVPAQLVGRETKERLMFMPNRDVAYEEYGYIPPLGASFTGIADAFRSFWFLGCLKFFFIAYLMRRLYEGARAGNLFAHLMYTILLVNALHTFTHTTGWILTAWLQMAIFTFPLFYFARTEERDGGDGLDGAAPAGLTGYHAAAG